MKRLCTLLALLAVCGVTGSARAASTAYLDLRVAGFGGTITADPPGTLVDPSCPNGTCVFAYPEGTRVTLVPNWASGSSFVGWKRFGNLPGSCYYQGNTCTTIVTGTQGLKAAFSPVRLSVDSTAGGWAEVLTRGQSCGNGCALLPYGTWGSIAAHANGGYSFDSWYGGCDGIGSRCDVSLNDNRSISAIFACHLSACQVQQPVTHDVTITVVPHGPGTAVVRGAQCRTLCRKTTPQTAMVSIEARPDPGASPTGWRTSGVRCLSGTRCSFPAFNDAYGRGPTIDVYFG